MTKVRIYSISNEMPDSKLTSKGQTTIPKVIREHLKLKSGDRIQFVIDAKGMVLMKPATVDISALNGLLYREGRAAVSVEEMDEAIESAVADDYRKSS